MFLSIADMTIDDSIEFDCPNALSVEQSLDFDERSIIEWCTLLGCSRKAKMITPQLIKHLTEDSSFDERTRNFYKKFFTQEEHFHPSMDIYANQELN